MKQHGLGKGLGALMGDAAMTEPESTGVTEADIYLLDNDTSQPRKTFDPDKLKELAESVKTHGIMQPIVVTKNGARYTIIAGERRFRAARLAGLEKVPVVVRDLSEREILEISLIENIQREDLNPIEQAAGIRRLMDEYGMTQDEAAKRVSKSRSAVANLLRLLTLPDSVAKLVTEGKLSAGHARCLLPLTDPKKIREAAQIIIDEDLSVREAEALVKRLMSGPAPKKAAKPVMSAEFREAQDTLSRALSTKVQIKGTEERGRITIDYYTADQLEELYEFLKKDE